MNIGQEHQGRTALVANYRKTLYYIVSPATGSSLGNLFRLRFHNLFSWIPFKFWLKLPLTSLTALIFSPFNLYERLALRKKLKEVQLDESPIFIVGHWRSGTTHLHNLLAQDKKLGYTTTMQCLFPNSFITNPLVKLFLKGFMPGTRPMDNVAIEMDSPQEDELGTANVNPNSFYNSWMFPKALWKNYKRYVRFAGVSESKREKWKRQYLYLLKKATLNSGLSRLVLKNPAHTARIPLLMEMFPKAKFIFLYRNPTTVYYSTLRLYQDALPQFALQSLTPEERDEGIFRIYEDLMKAYFEDRKLIPPENLMEIRFESLEKSRMEVLEEIYKKFNLPEWEVAKQDISKYLGAIKSYKKNAHQYSDAEIRVVQEKWKFAYDELGYASETVTKGI